MLRWHLSNLEQADLALVIDERSTLFSRPFQQRTNGSELNGTRTLTSALVLSVTSIMNSAPVSIICLRILSSTLTGKGESSGACQFTRFPLTQRRGCPSWKRTDTPFHRQSTDRGRRSVTRRCTGLRDQGGTSSSCRHRHGVGTGGEFP